MAIRTLLTVGATTAALAWGATFLNAAPDTQGDRCSPADRSRNEATVRIVYDEILSKGRFAENERIYHPDFKARGITHDATRAEDRAASQGWRKLAPDLKMTVLKMVSDCDHVAVHWEGTGTNTGEGNGLPATGRAIRVRGMTITRLVNGQIIEEWTSFDQYEFLKQLALLPQ